MTLPPPPGQPVPPPPSAAPAPVARTRTGAGVTAAIAVGAAVLGLAAGWLIPSPLGGGTGDAAASPSSLHAQACTLTEASFAGDVDPSQFELAGPEIAELTAISGLLQAAAAKDPDLADLRETGLDLMRGLQTLDGDMIVSTLDTVRAGC